MPQDRIADLRKHDTTTPPGVTAAPDTASALDRLIAGYIRGSMFQVLVVVTGLFLAMLLLMAQTVVAQHQARQEVMLQDEAVQSLSALMEIMLDAETGQRGFLLTSNPVYLQPFEHAKARLGPALALLQRRGVATGVAEQRHIARTRQLIRAKIAELDRTVVLAEAGMMPAALALVQTNAGQQDMSALRNELSWLRANQATRRRAAFDRVQLLEDRLLPLVGLLGVAMILLEIVALRGERHRASLAAEARQYAALRAANAEAQMLARELNHRVKNLFSVVLSIITVSSRNRVPSAAMLDDIRARVHALSLAHSSSQGLGVEESCRLADVINNILLPYAGGNADRAGIAARVRLAGPEVNLIARMITPMGLLMHELATNSSRYGALSVMSGVVEITWRVAIASAGERTLQLTWIELGGPALIDMELSTAAGSPPKTGFGSRLIQMATQQMGGSLERTWPTTGAQVIISCPLP